MSDFSDDGKWPFNPEDSVSETESLENTTTYRDIAFDYTLPYTIFGMSKDPRVRAKQVEVSDEAITQIIHILHMSINSGVKRECGKNMDWKSCE